MNSPSPSWVVPIPPRAPQAVTQWQPDPFSHSRDDSPPTTYRDLPWSHDEARFSPSWDGVAEYVLGRFAALPDVPQQYALRRPDADQTAHLLTLATLTHQGRLWFVQDRPIKIDIQEIRTGPLQTFQKRRGLKIVDAAIADLVRPGSGADLRHWSGPLDRYVVRPESMSPCDDTPGLRQLCTFLGSLRGFSPHYIGLAVTGWDWSQLDHPPLVLHMLAQHFTHLTVEVDRGSGLVSHVLAESR